MIMFLLELPMLEALFGKVAIIYNSLEDALTAANTAIAAWCDEIGLEMIDAWPK